MKLRVHTNDFDEKQIILARRLIRAIKGCVDEFEMDEETKDDLLESVAFQMAVFMDGDVVFNDKESSEPVLAFREDDDTLLISEQGAWMHEYIHGLLDDEEDEEGEVEEAAEVDAEADDEAADDEAAEVDEDSLFEIAISFASGLKLGVGYWEFEDPDELAHGIATNLHFVTTHEVRPDPPVDVVIGEICPALETVTSVTIRADNDEWRTLEEGGMAGLTIPDFAQRVGDYIKRELGKV